MATAVIRVTIDSDVQLTRDQYEQGLQSLRAIGFEVVAGQSVPPAHPDSEIEIIVEDQGRELPSDTILAHCRKAFRTEPKLGVVTYISRGTEEDARGVLSRFGVTGDVVRQIEHGEEVFVVSIAEATASHVAESRLHTALEAALNAEVRITLLP